jgi:parvulin-like peptidyl-prolyl isomerase
MSHRRRDTLPKSRQNAKLSASQRRVSRREREERKRKQLYIGLVAAAVLSVAIVAGFALNEYWFKPRTVLASVNGVEIRRRDYWKVRSVDLINQVNQYQQFAQLVDASQQQQYLQLAQQAATELDDIWGSTEIDDATLTRMVEDQIYLQNMEKLGVEVTEQDIDNYINAQFQPQDAPLFTPTPEPTLIPERAAWATETEAALQGEGAEPTEIAGSPVTDGGSPVADGSPTSALATPIAGNGSPESMSASPVLSGSAEASPVTSGNPEASPAATSASPGASPVTADASPVASPVTSYASPIGSPEASPAGSPEASPVGSPIASPVGSPEATATSTAAGLPTPNPTQALQTAEAGYEQYRDVVFDTAHLSRSDYESLIVRPAVARQKVEAVLLADVGQSAEQVHAAHILVDTKDLADQIYADLQAGSDFEQTAREQSNDTSTAENSGDLGWFTRGQMVKPFEVAAFGLQPGQISQPVQTQFGWHIIKVYEHDPDRAMTDQQLQQYRDAIVTRWVDEQRAAMDISSRVEPTPTPALSSFVPPPDAPPLPTPTLEPTIVEASPIAADGSPIATPVASPMAPSEATPVAASTIGSPEASPIGSPIGSPVGSPIASPEASPAWTPSPRSTTSPIPSATAV